MTRFCTRLGGIVLAVACSCATSAVASSGSSDSAAAALETIQPTVTALSVSTTREVTISFDEPVTGAETSANYAVSGNVGNLAATPDTAASAGGNDYALTWSAGEMLGGGNVTITASGIQDAVGNPVSLSADSASAASIFEAPSPGTATPPATADAAPIAIPFSSASDASSGIASVELWVRFDDGSAWANTGLTVSAAAGSFNFTPPGSSPANQGDYYFDLVAQDNAGNRSPEPSGTTGTGDGVTNYNIFANVNVWKEYGR